MDATATRARAKTALAAIASGLALLAIVAPAAPARAEETTPSAEESSPSVEESSPSVEESSPSAEESAPAAEASPVAEEVAADVEQVPAESGQTDILEPATAPAPSPRFDASPSPELSATVAPAEAEAQAPSEEEPAPASQPAQTQPQSVAEPEPDPGAASPGGDRDARLLTRVHARLDAVERGVRKVRRQIHAGTTPSPPLLEELRGGVRRLRAALGELERRSASEAAPIAGLDALQARLELVRRRATGLVAMLSAHAGASPQAGALIDELLALEGRPAPDAPALGVGRRAIHKHGRPAPQAAGSAYTHTYAWQTHSESGPAPLTRQPPASAAEAPASPRRSPGGPRAPSGSAAAASSALIFSVAGPAALALLLGLAIPRLARRLVELPVRRPPDRFASPPERPG